MKINKKDIIIIFIVILAGVFIFHTLNENNQQSSGDQHEIVLYFSDQNAQFLKPETRTITSDSLYKDTLKELIKGPENNNLNKTIPAGVKVLDISINNNVALINFNQALIENHWGGSTGERMTVYSIVNTMTQFDEINQVKIIVEGTDIETLVGHMDLSRPLKKNNKIIDQK